MKTIGIKLADGSFYPVLEDNSNQEKTLDLTTANNNQTTVMVDLYRSSLCSMEDAEYVDTLQIDNLVEHPNGEPDITFTISIDEDNQLSAKIVDRETGSQSKTSITLVSRTEEQRLQPDNYSISDSQIHSVSELEEKPTQKKALKGGLLAAATAIALANAKSESEKSNSEENSDNDLDDNPSTDFDKTTVTFDTAEDTLIMNTDELMESEENEITVTESPETEIVEQQVDFTSEENDKVQEDFVETTNLDMDTELPDFDSEFPEDAAVFVAEEENPLEDKTLDEQSFTADIPTEESVSNDNPTQEFNMNSETTDLSSDFSSTLPDLDFYNTTNESAESLEKAFDSYEISESTELSENTDLNDMSFDLPEESLNNNFDTTIEETTNLDTYDNLDVETNDDFSFDTDEIDIQETNFDDELNVDLNNLDSDFDQNNLSNENNTSDNIPVAGGISFTGLYDKETELGESSSFEEEEVKKRTKKPVIICIICAIICIIATILILFFVPGILKKDKIESEISETTIESPLPEEVVEEPIVEEVIPEAKEDEIIVVEKAEEVVPEQPPVVEEEEPAPKVITYKIKWGDTLWDIADTYYKNPWKYKFIAKHNNIKNPDHIISGTFIEIPEE